jgi:hypothetical protein
VLTDGEDNESGPITSDSIINKAKNYGIPIYAVGLEILVVLILLN